MYDAIIIGAGPAGLMAARKLRTRNFILIDKKSKIGEPLCCGEGIRKDGFLKLFNTTAFSFVKNEVSSFDIRINSKSRNIKIPYLMLDRPAFEQWLAHDIQNFLSLKTPCKEIIRMQDHMIVETDKKQLKARMVILACGCDYRFQQKFGLTKRPPVTVPCYGGVFHNHNLATDRLHFFFHDETRSGLWVFPKSKEVCNAGIAVFPFRMKTDIKTLFNDAVKRNGLKLKGRPSFGGVFPTTFPLKQTYDERLLVLGDAACLIYGGVGEGIYYALQSGIFAAKTANKAIETKTFSKKVLKTYEDDWKAAFGDEIFAGKVFDYIFAMGFTIKKLGILFSIPKEKECIDLFLKGKVPCKARAAYYLIRLIEPILRMRYGIRM